MSRVLATTTESGGNVFLLWCIDWSGKTVDYPLGFGWDNKVKFSLIMLYGDKTVTANKHKPRFKIAKIVSFCKEPPIKKKYH